MNDNLPKAILFDLDDTILQFERPEIGWRRSCEKYMPSIRSDVNIEVLLGAIIDRRDWYWGDAERHRIGRFDLDAASRNVVRAAFELLDVGSETVADQIADDYRSGREGKEKPFPGAIDTLRLLRQSEVKLALITNGRADMQRAKVVRHELEPFFDNILIEGEFGVGKPHQRVYEYTLDKLNTHSDDAWMVGDNLEWEVEAPQKLGIFSVWVDAYQTGLPCSSTIVPDRTVQSITELL